jgi:Flp pilus assembly protein TadG
MKSNKTPERSERGQAMAEFAIILPILLVLLLGIVQFGLVYNNWVTLTDAVRAGARKAAVSRTDSNRNADVITAVKSAATDLSASKLTVDTPVSTWSPGDTVKVCAHYPYSISLLPGTTWGVSKSGSLDSCTTERVE